VNVDCETQHISEFIADKIKEGKVSLGETQKKVTYHDPCRLGRHLGIFEPPREVIEAIPGITLGELKHSKEESPCCGTSAFTNCDAYSKQIRIERLLEVKSTGADILVTSCPKCQIHLRCAMVSKGKEKWPDVEIKVMDIVNLVANALKGEMYE